MVNWQSRKIRGCRHAEDGLIATGGEGFKAHGFDQGLSAGTAGWLMRLAKKDSTAVRTAGPEWASKMDLRRWAPLGTPWVNQAANCFILPTQSRWRLVARDLAGGDDGCGARGFGGLFEGDLVDQHLEVGADHAVTVCIGRDVVGADAGGLLAGGVLRDLAEDPGIGGRGAADHDGVAVGGVDHGGGVLGSADVAVADDGDAHGVLDGGDVLPAGLAGVAVLAGAGVQGDGVEAAVLGEARELDADDLLRRSIPCGT